jgi:acid phosphatase (class A)
MIRVLLVVVLAAGAPSSDAPSRYLLSGDMPDLARILPQAPTPGSPRAIADRAVFAATRKLKQTPRWALATRDVSSDRFAAFACAIGGRIDPTAAPALGRVLAQMGDPGMVARAKASFAVPRPYLSTALPICEAKSQHLAVNGDYPSGHASSGWATALVLAELMPARATEILRRGRIYGESRYICGSHSLSAVEAGYMAGAVMVARLHASAAFRRDMDAARVEVDRLLTAVPPGGCG